MLSESDFADFRAKTVLAKQQHINATLLYVELRCALSLDDQGWKTCRVVRNVVYVMEQSRNTEQHRGIVYVHHVN